MPSPLAELRRWLDAMIETPRKLAELERRMSKVTDALAVVNQATNNLAERVRELAARVEATDNTTATALLEVATRLDGIGVDESAPGGDESPLPPVDGDGETPAV